MKDEFDKLALAGKIKITHIETLVQLTQSGFCSHRSWGLGRIKTVDTVFARFTIDFHGKAGHNMDLGFAAESLKPIDKNHILARKVSDLEGLRQMAALHHLDLIKLVIQSYDGRASLDQIQQVLVPDVIADDWKKWLEVAKREMKKDGHFTVPLKKSEAIVYQQSEISLPDRLLAEFRAAKGLKLKTVVALEALKQFDDIQNKAQVAGEFIAGLNADIVSHQRTQPGTALEAIFARDDLRVAGGLPASVEGDVTAKNIWGQDLRLAPILDQVPAAKHKRVLASYKESNPAIWHEAALFTLNIVPAKVAGECAALLIQEGKLQQLKDTLSKLISHHTASSELLLWLAKERSDSWADILGPEVFRAALTAMERDQFNEKKSNRLRDYILDDQELLVELIGSADFEVIKDLTRALRLSPCFDDMDKRSLLARIVKKYPAVQSLISGEQGKQDSTLLVSWESLQKRQSEYQDLVQKKIPANSKEIAIARSYGDLRENHEYKAAKEMQKILMRRKGELEAELNRARGTDFSQAKTDVVGIGTIVTVTDLGSKQTDTFTILGAWDGDPDKGILSYQTPLAKSLMGKKPGEEADFEMEGDKKRFRIESIKAAPVVPAPATEEAAPVVS
jgi:transcription elongation factor GreA